jgi:hypothetical protein
MNTNELADIVDRWAWKESAEYLTDAATMLRQQQDRIKVLEANHKIQKDINDAALQYIEQLEQGLKASINLNRAQNERK